MDFISPLIGGIFNAGETIQNNRNQQQLAQYQNAFNLEMWNKNNEYNSPTETLKRLSSAGINPRSYNNLGQFANASDAPQAATYDKRSPLAAFSELMQTALSMESLKANTSKSKAEAEKAKADAEKAKADAALSGSRKLYTDEERERAFFIEDDRRIKEEIYRLERGLNFGIGRGFYKNGESIFTQKSFQDYIEAVKQSRYYNSLSDKERYNLRRFENQLKHMEIDSLEYIPKQYRYIIDKLLYLF